MTLPKLTLYVDSDPARRRDVSARLEGFPDIDVHAAGSGDEARSIVRSESIDCVVLYYPYEGGDGLSLLAELGAEAPGALTILYSNRSEKRLIEEAYAASVDEFVHDSTPDQMSVISHKISNYTGTDALDAGLADSRDHYEALAETTPDGILTIDADSVVQFANPAVEEILGYAPADLIGESLTEIMPTGLTGRHRQEFQRYLETGERQLDWERVEFPGQHRDGHEVPLSVSFSEFTVDGDRYFTGLVRDVTRRHRREEQLRELSETTQRLIAAETAEAVGRIATETASEVLDFPLTVVDAFDDDAGRFEPLSRTPEVRSLVGDAPLFGPEFDVPLRVYTESEGRVVSESELSGRDTPLRSAIVLPLGGHGVFVSGATAADAFSDTDVLLARILTGNVQTALDAVERERSLREQKEKLEERTVRLERANHINRVVRDLTQALVRASSREEIEETVCVKLANADPYRFAWIGTRQTVSGEIVPTASAGVERGYLDEITITADETGIGRGPVGRAMRTHESQVQNNLYADPPFEPWRTEAIQRGYRANVSVPIQYRNSLYGVLNLYAEETEIFDDLEVNVLEELGDVTGYAINALERKKVLVSERAVELTFDIWDPDVLALRCARESGSQFEFDSLIERVDGSLRTFFTVFDTDPETVTEYSSRSTAVTDVTLLGQRAEGYRYEATLTTESFFADLLEYGAHPTALTATPDGGRLTVELPRSGDVQAFLDMLLETYREVELVARKELDRPIQTEEEFQALYKKQLTDRQEEVIKTAYFAGFFEWPRESTGGEVAEMLGVTQPTVNRHIRAGERALFELVFDDPDRN